MLSYSILSISFLINAEVLCIVMFNAYIYSILFCLSILYILIYINIHIYSAEKTL